MHKLGFYVPESHLDLVKEALFAVGAGRIGDYDSCCWQVKGVGQFRPLQDSKPYIGQPGEIEQLVEYRIELVCDDHLVKAAVAALLAAHPYEEPAWDLVHLVTELPD